MKHLTIGTAIGLLTITVIACGPTPEDLRVADQWLETDCVGPDGATITARLRGTDERLERYFTTAFDSGPSAPHRARTDSAGRHLHQIVATAIDTNNTVVFPGGGAFVTAGDSTFAAAFVASYIVGYRSRALAALGVIATQNARAKIVAVAADTSSPFNHQARIIEAEMSVPPGFYRIK
ncbi:MAG TPA: hypothetical protein VNA88_16360 [Candidatus Kapabacteria bacterium]|nr:hypothetical protein [Candidatus Kapabacteria bacterium]